MACHLLLRLIGQSKCITNFYVFGFNFVVFKHRLYSALNNKGVSFKVSVQLQLAVKFAFEMTEPLNSL